MFVLQAAALAAIVASDPPYVQVAAAISLLVPPGILALSFGIAILQGQRRFTAFNLLRILPSTAYVASVVIVFGLNATSLVLFMALWAAVQVVGGFLALAFAVRGLPRHAGEGLGAVAGANGEVRAQGPAGNSVASRFGTTRSGCRWALLEPRGPRTLRRGSGLHVTASRSCIQHRHASRIRTSPPSSTATRHAAPCGTSSSWGSGCRR